MKRTFTFSLVLFICLSLFLSACADTSVIYSGNTYSLITKDQKCYLQFQDIFPTASNASGSDNTMSVLEDTPPTFSSVAAMQQAFLTDTLSDDDKAYLMSISANRTVEIFNPNQLYDVQLPSGFASSQISLYKNVYSFDITHPTMHGYIDCYFNSDAYQNKCNEEFYNYLDYSIFLPHHTICSDMQITDRDARELRVDSGEITLKHLLYTIQTDSGELHVREQYLLRDAVSNRTTSEYIPEKVEIVGYDQDAQFHIWLTGFSSRPSVEWLKTFRFIELEQ